MTSEINTIYSDEELRVFEFLRLTSDDIKKMSEKRAEEQKLRELQSIGIVNTSTGFDFNALGKYIISGGATVIAGYVVYRSFTYAVDSAVNAGYKLDANFKCGSLISGSIKLSPVK
jgi:hypothetical protein